MPLGQDQQGQPQQYSDTSAISNTNYLYKITAVGANSTGESDYSSPTSGFMPPIIPTKRMEVVLEGAADGYWLGKLKNKFGIQNSVGGYEGYTAYKEYGTNSSKCDYQTNITVPSTYMVPQRVVNPSYHNGNYYSPPINQTTQYGLYGDTLFGLYHEVTIGGVPKLVWLKDWVYNESMLLDDGTTEAYAVYRDECQYALYGINFIIPDYIDIDYNIKNMCFDIDTKLENRSKNIGYNGASGENYPKYGWLNYEFWHKEFGYFPAVYPEGYTYGTGKTPLTRTPGTPYDYENQYLRIPSIPNGHAHHDPQNKSWGTNPTGKKYRIALASRFMNLGTFNGTANVVGAGTNYSVESKIVWTSEYKRTDQYGSPYISSKYTAGQLTDNNFTNWEIPVDYRGYANTIKLKDLCSQDLVNAGIRPWLTPADFTLWHNNRRQKIINLHLTILQKIKQRYPKILWSFYSMGGGENTGSSTYSITEYRNRQGPSITGKTVYDLWLEGGVEIWSTTYNDRDSRGNTIPRNDADILSGVILGAGLPLEFAFHPNYQYAPKNKILNHLAYGQIMAAQDWLNTAAYFVDDPEDNILYNVYASNNRFHDNLSGAKYCKYLMDRTVRGLNEANEWLDQTYGITKPTFLYVTDCYEPNAYSAQPSSAQQNGRSGEKNRFYHGRIHPKTWKKWIFDYIDAEVKRPGSYITGYARWQGSISGHRGTRPPQSPTLWRLKFESLYVENFPSGSDLISVNNTSSGAPQTYSGDGDYNYANSAAWAGSSIRDTDNAIIGLRRGDLLGYKRDPGDANIYFGNCPYGQNAFYYYGKYLYMLYNYCYTGEQLDYWVDPNPFNHTRYFFNPNSTITLTANARNILDYPNTRTRLINTFNTYLKPKYWDNDIGVYINTSVPTNPGTTNNYIISNPSNYYWYDFRVVLNDPSNYLIPTSVQDTIFNAKFPDATTRPTKSLYNYPPIPQYNFARVPYNCSDRIIPWVQFFAPSVARKDTVLLHDDRTNRSVFCHKYLKFKTYSSPFDWALVDQKDGNGEFLLPEFLDLDSLLAINLRRNFIYLPYGRTIKTNTNSISGDDSDNRTLWMWGNISLINNLLVDRTTIPFDYLSTAQANEITTDDGRDPIYNISYINKSYPTGTVPSPGFFDAATGQLDTAFSQSTIINKKPFPKEPLDIKYLEKYIKQGMTTFANNVKSKYSSSSLKLKPEFIAYMGNVPFGDMFAGETRMKMPLAYHMDPRSVENKEIWIKMLNDATKHWVDNFRSPVDGMARMIIDSAAAYPTFYCEFANESMTKAPLYSLSGGTFADTNYDYRYFYRNTGHINNFLLWYIGSNMTYFADTGLQTYENPYGGLLLDPTKSIYFNEVRNFKIGMELSQSSVFWTAIEPSQHVGNSRRRTNQNMSEILYNYGFERCGTDSNPKYYTKAYNAGISDVEFCGNYYTPCTVKGVANGSWSWNRFIISPIAANCTYGNSKYGLVPSNHWSQKLFNDSDYTPDLFVAPFDALETFPNVLRDKINNLNNIAIAKTSTGADTTTNNNIFEDLSVDKIYTNFPKNSAGTNSPNEANWNNDTTLSSQPEGTLPRSILLDSHLTMNSMKCRDQYGRTGIEGAVTNAPTFPNNKTAVKGNNNIHMTGEMIASASLQNPALLEPQYYPMFHNTFTENDGTKVVWKKCVGSDIAMQKFINWVSLNRTQTGGDFNALPIDHLKSDMRYILNYSENNTRKYWYADSYVNNSSNSLSGLSWSWMRDRRFTIFVLWPLLLKRGMSIITDLFGPTSYDPNLSLFMNINYDPNDPNEPLIKPPTREELLYVFMSSGISNPEMLEGFFQLFHISLDFSSPNVQGLWATTWNNSSLDSSLFVKSFVVTGRLSANPTAGKDETIKSASDAVTFFNTNNIPESRRVIIPNYLNAAYGDFYWLTNGGYNASSCTAGQPCDPRISYDLATNTGDACKDSSGTIVKQIISNDPRISTNPKGYSGSLTFASPWQDTVNTRVKTSWNNWLTSYNTEGGKVSYIVGDIIDSENLSNVGVFSEFLRKNPADGGDEILTHINKIVDDPRTNSTTAGNAATYGTLKSQLKLDSGYTTADFNIRDLTGSKGGYKLWNFVTSRLTAFYLNEALYNTTKAIFPNIKLSNYDNTKIFESDKLSDLNGHKSYVNNNIGNYVAVALYGEWNAGNIYQIDSTDPTSLVYNPTSSTPFGTTAWNSFAVSQQRLRAVDRNRLADGKQLQVWLASINYYDGNSFGGNTTQHNNYWRENAYHALLRNPDPILYWNSSSASTPALEKEMSDVIKQVNSQTNMKIVSTVSSSNDKINYNTTFIASGCKTRGTDYFFVDDINLWRITVDFNKVETVIIDGTTYNLKTIYATNGIPAVGFWYKTDKTKIKILQSNYNSSTKTLTLVSSIV